MPNWIDCTPDLGGQPFCTRLCFWPCQCGVALTNAVINCDVAGVWKVLCCCPCRTVCGWCPTEAEKNLHNDEPEEIPYHRVFAMEKKKREILHPHPPPPQHHPPRPPHHPAHPH